MIQKHDPFLEHLWRLDELAHTKATSEEDRHVALCIRQQIELYLSINNAEHATDNHPTAATAPRAAQFCLVALLSEVKADAIVGDLNDRFQRDNERFGPRQARYLYWARTIRSLWPLLRRAIARAIKFGAFAEVVRRFLNG